MIKKHSKSFIGTCELRFLPKGTHFKLLDKNGKPSRTIYIKDDYNFSDKVFFCSKTNDVYGDWSAIKGTRKVTTDFEY